VIEFTDKTKAFDVQEVAEFLKVIPITVRNRIKAGELAAVKIKGKYYITEEALRDYVREVTSK
jgi:excisionase family DNA binding protein